MKIVGLGIIKLFLTREVDELFWTGSDRAYKKYSWTATGFLRAKDDFWAGIKSFFKKLFGLGRAGPRKKLLDLARP